MDWSDDTDTQPSRGPSQQGPEAQGRSATSQTAVRHEPNPMKIDSGVDVAASESSGVIWSGSVRPWYADAFPIEATPIPQHQSPIQESHIGGYPSSGEEAKSSLGTGLGLGQEVGSGRLSGVRLSAAIESDGYLPDARDLSKSPTPEMTSPMISRGLAKSDGTGTQSEERVCVRCHNLPFPVPPQLPPGGSNGFGYPFRWRNGYLCDRCKMLEHAESLLRGMVVFQSMLTDTETVSEPDNRL